jgi:hypothetical protein
LCPGRIGLGMGKAMYEVSDECIKKSILVVTYVEDLIKQIEEHFKAGFTKIYSQSAIPN